ncbi:hypothetical protein ACVIGB_001017 [Bradyrhizobium sp. USDA 4341]
MQSTKRRCQIGRPNRCGVNGVEIIAPPESFPESVLECVREFADRHPEIEVEIAGGLTNQCREMEKAAADFEARAEAVRFAIANTAIEGGHVLPETEELMNEWARGEIGDDELIEQGQKQFTPGV